MNERIRLQQRPDPSPVKGEQASGVELQTQCITEVKDFPDPWVCWCFVFSIFRIFLMAKIRINSLILFFFFVIIVHDKWTYIGHDTWTMQASDDTELAIAFQQELSYHPLCVRLDPARPSFIFHPPCSPKEVSKSLLLPAFVQPEDVQAKF